jgi:hypothetical protein
MDMKIGKSLGPDGFTSNFFQKYWKIIRKGIWEVVDESRKSGSILKYFNATFLVLIPKEKEANTTEKFKPIAICNVIYKIVSKLVANRLKPLLKYIVSKEKGGFVEGRQVLDGIFIAHEIVHSVKKNRKEGMLIKLDMSKEYDQISCHFPR